MGCRSSITCAFIHNLRTVQCVHRGPSTTSVSDSVRGESLIKRSLTATHDFGGNANQPHHFAGALDGAFGAPAYCSNPRDSRPAVTAGAIVSVNGMGGRHLGQYSKRNAVLWATEVRKHPCIVLRVRNRQRPPQPMFVAIPARNTRMCIVAEIKSDGL